MLVRTFGAKVLRPIHSPHLAINRPVRLPAGGPVGVGGAYAAGTVLGAVTSATPASEVRTLTITGSPTGYNGTFTYTADKTYTAALANLVTAIPTAAQVQAALQSIFGAGNVTVTGPSSGVFTLTFAGVLANVRIGGLLAFTAAFTAGSTPAAALATSTQGTAGVGQYDAYDDTKSDGTQTARALLERDFLSDPQGGRVDEHGPTGQPFSPPAFEAGYFRCGDLVGLDAAAVADLGKIVEGTLYSNAEACLRIT